MTGDPTVSSYSSHLEAPDPRDDLKGPDVLREAARIARGWDA